MELSIERKKLIKPPTEFQKLCIDQFLLSFSYSTGLLFFSAIRLKYDYFFPPKIEINKVFEISTYFLLCCVLGLVIAYLANLEAKKKLINYSKMQVFVIAIFGITGLFIPTLIWSFLFPLEYLYQTGAEYFLGFVTQIICASSYCFQYLKESE